MMGIIIALSIRTTHYCYWMLFIRRSYGCATKTSYNTILWSQDICDRILILQCIWRHYQVVIFPMWGVPKGNWKILHRFFLGLHKVEYWRCCKLSIYDLWWDHDSNVYTYEILSLMAEWDAENCIDTWLTFHTRESYVLKSQIHDPDTPT